MTDTLLWAADFSALHDSNQAGFGNVQRQSGGGSIQNSRTPIPAYSHPSLGYCLKLALPRKGERLEAEPPVGGNLAEGQDYHFRVDFVLDPAFPIAQTNSWCLINQIHQGSGSGSPPLEFDVHNSALWARGNSTAYNKKLCALQVDVKYSLVYRVVFSATASKSLVEVWVNGTSVLSNYVPACPMLNGGDSYWKGATMYCDPSIPPLTVYQNAHRMGTSYAAVTP